MNFITKLRASVETIFPETICIIFIVAFLSAIPVRIYQLKNLIEPTTGFYNENHNSILIPVLYAILVASVAFIIAFSYLSGSMPKTKNLEGQNSGFGIICICMAVSFVYDAGMVVINLVNGFASGSAGMSFMRFLRSADGFPYLIQAVFGFISAFYFFIYGVSYIKGKAGFEKVGMIALAPVGWAIGRIVYRFMTPISFTKVSELLFELIMLAFLMIFFITFARITTEVQNEDKMWAIFAAGLPAALFCFLCSLPRLTMYIMGRKDLVTISSALEFSDLTCGIFILVYIVMQVTIGKRPERPAIWNDDGGYDEDGEDEDEYENEDDAIRPLPNQNPLMQNGPMPTAFQSPYWQAANAAGIPAGQPFPPTGAAPQQQVPPQPYGMPQSGQAYQYQYVPGQQQPGQGPFQYNNYPQPQMQPQVQVPQAGQGFNPAAPGQKDEAYEIAMQYSNFYYENGQTSSGGSILDDVN